MNADENLQSMSKICKPLQLAYASSPIKRLPVVLGITSGLVVFARRLTVVSCRSSNNSPIEYCRCLCEYSVCDCPGFGSSS